MGTIRRLGAEVLEFPVGESDAIVGVTVNQTRLPREALVSVIVREDEALLPRGSTEIEAGDRLHILVRGQVRDSVEDLFERWRLGPLAEPEPSVPVLAGRPPIFSVKPLAGGDGRPGAPQTASTGWRCAGRCGRGASNPERSCCWQTAVWRSPGAAWWPLGGARQLFRYCRERIERAESAAGAGVVAGGGRRGVADDGQVRRPSRLAAARRRLLPTQRQ